MRPVGFVVERITAATPKKRPSCRRFTVAQRTVTKSMVQRPRRSPSQNWTSFLRNHLGQMVCLDLFTVPIFRFQVLYVLLVLSHARRKVLHFNVTAAPSALWTVQQFREASPFTSPPKYLLRDRDGIYGGAFKHCAEAFGRGLLWRRDRDSEPGPACRPRRALHPVLQHGALLADVRGVAHRVLTPVRLPQGSDP